MFCVNTAANVGEKKEKWFSDSFKKLPEGPETPQLESESAEVGRWDAGLEQKEQRA